MNSTLNFQQSFTFPESTTAPFQFPIPSLLPPLLPIPPLPNQVIPDITKHTFPNICNLVIPPPPPPPSTFQIDRVCTPSNEELVDSTEFTDPIRSQIEMEKCYYTEKKQILAQLHEVYDTKLRGLKQEIIELKLKCAIVEQQPSQHQIQSILEKKQRAHETRQQQQLVRSQDEKQLNVLSVENNNLKVIVDTLNKQLETLVTQMSDHEQAQYLQDNMASYAMGDNKYFQEILTDNRRLERQIKFIKHIIEQESNRSNIKLNTDI